MIVFHTGKCAQTLRIWEKRHQEKLLSSTKGCFQYWIYWLRALHRICYWNFDRIYMCHLCFCVQVTFKICDLIIELILVEVLAVCGWLYGQPLICDRILFYGLYVRFFITNLLNVIEKWSQSIIYFITARSVSWWLMASNFTFLFASWLLQERPEIRDEQNAQPLKFKGGRIEFDNVIFG